MAQVDRKQKDVQVILDSLRSYIDQISQFPWDPSDGVLTIVFRSTLRRQFEALEVSSYLIANRKGFSVAQLLRPACEEFIWSKYLTSNLSDAEALVRCLCAKEIRESLHAEDQHVGRSAIRARGILPFLKKAEKQRTSERQLLRNLGRKLGWPKRDVDSGRFPSISWLARKTDELDTYKLIYHATSRFVHFSASELTRGAWYNPETGTASISFRQFRDVHGHLCLYWGVLLLFQTWNEVDSFLDQRSEIDVDAITEAVSRISESGRPPIITPEELQVPW